MLHYYTMELRIKKLVPNAVLPNYAHKGDAGMDLFTYEMVTIKPGERAQVKTGIAMAIPEGYVGLIWDKSGLSQKFGLKNLGGVVDSGYRGEIMVGIVNLGKEDYKFEPGQKVAQLLIQKVESPKIEEVENLEEGLRGENGFGSTGK